MNQQGSDWLFADEDILAYNKAKLETAPQSWADFWDLKKFPGSRTLWKQPSGMLERIQRILKPDWKPQFRVSPLNWLFVTVTVSPISASQARWAASVERTGT